MSGWNLRTAPGTEMPRDPNSLGCAESPPPGLGSAQRVRPPGGWEVRGRAPPRCLPLPGLELRLLAPVPTLRVNYSPARLASAAGEASVLITKCPA